MIARLPSRKTVVLAGLQWVFWRLVKSSLFILPPKELIYVVKYIVLIVVIILSTVAVSVAVAVPIALQNPASNSAVGAPESTYMFILKSNDKDNFIITTLADRRLIRLQLILELDASFTPKDLKNPDRRMLVLQDSLLRVVRACRSDELSAQNQNLFKKRIEDTATRILGNNAVRAVYLTGLTVQ